MQKIVWQSQGRSFRLASKDVKDRFLGVGFDLGKVRKVVDVEVTFFADSKQLVCILVDRKDLANTGAVVNVGLGPDSSLAPLFLSQVHDLLGRTSTLDRS